jgi:hypothetical protein
LNQADRIERHRAKRTESLWPAFVERHDAIGVPIRERGKIDRVRVAEDAGDGRDADDECSEGDQREHRRAPEDARGKPEIGGQLVEQAHGSPLGV